MGGRPAPPTTDASPPSVRLRDHFRDQARVAILAAAEQEFADEGLRDAKVERIARRAGVSVGTLYNLFGDRERLAVELLDLRKNELVTILEQAVSTATSFRPQLLTMVRSLFEYFAKHRRFFRVAMEAEHTCGVTIDGSRDAREAMMRTVQALFARLVGNGIEEGVLRVEGRELYAPILMGMLREVVKADTGSAENSCDDRADRVIDIFLNGAGKE